MAVLYQRLLPSQRERNCLSEHFNGSQRWSASVTAIELVELKAIAELTESTPNRLQIKLHLSLVPGHNLPDRHYLQTMLCYEYVEQG